MRMGKLLKPSAMRMGKNFPISPCAMAIFFKKRLPDLGGVAGENNKYY